MVEHRFHKATVASSILALGTIKSRPTLGRLLIVLRKRGEAPSLADARIHPDPPAGGKVRIRKGASEGSEATRTIHLIINHP